MKTYLRKGKTLPQAVRNEEKIKGEKQPVDMKVRKEGDGGSFPGAGAEISLQCMEETMVEQIFSGSLWRGP